ncbi:MAG: DMT family transporter [Anaerolineales bacterium]|nr:DMT family transporter [Anaerolineales bacterium]
MTLEAVPYITLLGFLYGSTLIASRFSIGQFEPTTFAGLRLLLAGLGHLAYFWLAGGRRRWPVDLRLRRHAVFLGVLGTAVPMTLIVTALQYLSSGIAAVLITTNPAVTVLLAHFLLVDERLNGRKSAGVALALVGAAVLAFSGESGLPDVSQADPRGYLLMSAAMLMGSGMTIYIRRYMQDMDVLAVSRVRLVTAAVVVMPLSALFVGVDLGQVTGPGYAALGYSAVVGTFGGMLMEFYNVKRFGATAGAMTAYVIPMVAVAGGWLLLDERITPTMLGGMGLIVEGIALLNRGSRGAGGQRSREA